MSFRANRSIRVPHSQVNGVLVPSQVIFDRKPVMPRRSSMVSMTCDLARSTSASQSCDGTLLSASPFVVLTDSASGRRWPTGTSTTMESLPSGAADVSLGSARIQVALATLTFGMGR